MAQPLVAPRGSTASSGIICCHSASLPTRPRRLADGQHLRPHGSTSLRPGEDREHYRRPCAERSRRCRIQPGLPDPRHRGRRRSTRAEYGHRASHRHLAGRSRRPRLWPGVHTGWPDPRSCRRQRDHDFAERRERATQGIARVRPGREHAIPVLQPGRQSALHRRSQRHPGHVGRDHASGHQGDKHHQRRRFHRCQPQREIHGHRRLRRERPALESRHRQGDRNHARP